MQIFKALLITGAVLLPFAMGGCASQPVAKSYAKGVTSGSAEIVVPAIVDYVSYKLPAAQSTIYLAKSKHHNLDEVITDAFKARGYAISNVAFSEEEAIHIVRYEVSPLANGLLVNVYIDQKRASTMAVYWQKKWFWLGKYTVGGDRNV